MLLSIVVPVFNERETLVEILRQVLAVELPIERELVLVDDFSTDGTRDLYASLSDEFPGAKIQVVQHAHNQGKGAAVRTGFEHVSGDLVIIQDADLEYSPKDYPRVLAPLLEDRADVVYGSRYLGAEERRVLSFWHFLANRFLTVASNVFTDLHLTDMETCYKCFRTEVIRSIKLKSDRFGIEPEITAKIARGGWRICEVPIHYAGRTYAEGKKITWRDGVRALYSIVRFAWSD